MLESCVKTAELENQTLPDVYDPLLSTSTTLLNTTQTYLSGLKQKISVVLTDMISESFAVKNEMTKMLREKLDATESDLLISQNHNDEMKEQLQEYPFDHNDFEFENFQYEDLAESDDSVIEPPIHLMINEENADEHFDNGSDEAITRD